MKRSSSHDKKRSTLTSVNLSSQVLQSKKLWWGVIAPTFRTKISHHRAAQKPRGRFAYNDGCGETTRSR